MQIGRPFCNIRATNVVVPFLGVLLLLTVVAPAPARTVKARVMVVNISALGSGDEITDADLLRIAMLENSDNKKLFPKIRNLTLKFGGENLSYSPGVAIEAKPLSFSGNLRQEMRLEFVSLANIKGAGKFDVVVVGSDGSLNKYDKEIVINKLERTIKSYAAIEVGGGDVVLLFVRDVKITQFNGVREEGTRNVLG
jgi:hypothetical protein